MAAALRRTLAQGSRAVLPRLIVASPAESYNILGSVCVIPNRTKISKSSPFGKRPNPKAAQREDFIKKNRNIKEMVGKSKSVQAPVLIDSTGTVVSNYIPLKRKAFILTPTGLMQRWDAFKNGLWTIYSLAFIKKYCKPFKLKQFAEEAQDIYIGVNKALISKDKKKLEELATGSVYHALKKEFFHDNKQLHWRFVRQVDRPRVVHARVVPVDSKENLFAQVTVKVNSEQVSRLWLVVI
ncbi:hypothetical protein QZH41_014104 [Actinostola sp. cb2023]|nr:hypothetical protein QZH41_014104 [Actinostola sp. cb2023]